MGGVGGDGRAAGEVAGDGLPGGEEDVGGEAQPEDPLRRLASSPLAVVVGVAHVAAGGDEPVAAVWLTRRGKRGQQAAGGGGLWPPAGGGAGDAGGEVGEAEAHVGEEWLSGFFGGGVRYTMAVRGCLTAVPARPA